tara:strand:- start:17904 stop:19472 length:1569 start_codon:yes stop_codon:yes gene_type:complete
MSSSNPHFEGIEIETTLPKPWEMEETFNDVLYDWMSRAPWLAISAIAHGAAIFLLAAIPWNMFDKPEETIIQASVDTPPEDVVEEPPPEEPEEVEEIESEEEPIVEDFEVSDHNETDTDDEFAESEGDPDQSSNSPFDSKAFNNMIGIGGGAGGKFGNRRGGRKNLKAGSGQEAAIENGLKWLKDHQSPEGYWDVDEYYLNNVVGGTDCSEGAGSNGQDIGMTGLALLAFLGDNHTLLEGKYKGVVTKGINWLKKQQDSESGLFGEQLGHAFIYDHGIAALAMTEAYFLSKKNPVYKSTAQKAINFITKARNPYGAWRYDYPATGDNDTSVTGWMVFALKSAEDAGLKIDKEAYTGAMNWIEEATEESSGRVGYDRTGDFSSRIENVNDHYEREKGEGMTAVGLLCRFFLGQKPDDTPMMKRHADLLQAKLPEWDPEGNACDMYYWYYGTYAMYQMGDSHWRNWEKSMDKAVVKSQRTEGDYLGSWDPVGPWGYSGGRVYSTALMVLCIEVYYRYARVLGAR